MKNLHVLQSNNSSRLVSEMGFKKYLKLATIGDLDIQPQNIYITSDEEIKKEKEYWFLTKDLMVLKSKNTNEKGYSPKGKKIILTTDQDLIKDGVQAIDDEFLEWFVKNPSCEEVDVKYNYVCSNCNEDKNNPKYENCHGNYKTHIILKIIIPNEEPKQRLEKYSERFDNKDNEIVEGIFNPETWGKRIVSPLVEELTGVIPNQETLEEAAELYKKLYEFRIKKEQTQRKEAFIHGAKWQAEKMYSEEEVEEYLDYYETSVPVTIKQWFEQFKKK